MKSASRGVARQVLRIGLLLLVAVFALQLYFFARVALMAVVDPQSTSFERSEIWRLLVERHALAWQQTGVDSRRLSPNLKRAVIASEDAGFTGHHGVEWDALERAWQRNRTAEARTGQANARLDRRPTAARRATASAPGPAATTAASSGARHSLARAEARLVGASTITQQLAKNLFLGSERTLARKAQEFVITFMLEAVLSKARILDIYLNNVEWGAGVFGAEAASQHYFGIPASALGPNQAARLAVLLPAPRRFETQTGSTYVASRAATIAARMASVTVPRE